MPRFRAGHINATDIDGNSMHVDVDGFIARVHQHELDHCHGMEYLNYRPTDGPLYGTEHTNDVR